MQEDVNFPPYATKSEPTIKTPERLAVDPSPSFLKTTTTIRVDYVHTDLTRSSIGVEIAYGFDFVT